MTNLEELRLILTKEKFERQELLKERAHNLFYDYVELFDDALEEFKKFGSRHVELRKIEHRTPEHEEELALMWVAQLNLFRVMEPLVIMSLNNHETFKNLLQDGNIVEINCKQLVKEHDKRKSSKI